MGRGGGLGEVDVTVRRKMPTSGLLLGRTVTAGSEMTAYFKIAERAFPVFSPQDTHFK